MCTALIRRAWIVVTLGVFAASVAAQTPQAEALKKQVEDLGGQVRDLTVRLAEAQRQIDVLEADRAELFKALRAAQDALVAAQQTRGTSTPPPLKAPTPADPYASPASLRAELIRRYLAEVASLPGADATEPAAREEHARNVERWCRLTARLVRGKSAWTVRLENLLPAEDPRRRDEWTARATVVDGPSGLPIGDPFPTVIPTRLAQRVSRESRTGDAGEPRLWRATVTIAAAPQFNPRGSGPEPFRTEEFIGRHAEFRYTIDWHAIVPADAEPKAGNPLEPTNPPGR
ncbi:MAG: hypothetical protein ACKVU4_00820 [Phycisphaerales bacterium]